MPSRNRFRVVSFVASLGALTVSVVGICDRAAVLAADPPALASNRGKAAIAPVAPILPAEIVAALQEGKFAQAETALSGLKAKSDKPAERTYLALMTGIAQRLGGKTDVARTTLREALDAEPKGPWSLKLRQELAGVELATGRLAEAEALARTEAETLLAGDRKDRLAEVYHAFARRLLKPDDSITPADPNAAYQLLEQARSLAKGRTLRARLLYEMGRASQEAKNPGRAIQNFDLYLKEAPQGADRYSVRFHLGAAYRDTGQLVLARRTWTDLAKDLEGKGLPKEKETDEIRAQSLYAIAQTYRGQGQGQAPNATDNRQLSLGVAALKRFLAAYPAHPLAVRAAFQVGQLYLAHGKSEEAVQAFLAFLKEDGFRAESDEAKRTLADLSMRATFTIAEILRGQQKFDEAINGWKGYLTKYPNGPQSADAQRAILDTLLMTAADHLQHERFEQARASWNLFVAQNPLDPRVPEILFQVGNSFITEKKFDQAAVAWEPLLSKFPQSEPAAHAQFLIASVEETEKGDLEKAIDRFRKIAVEPWHSQALQRIAGMEAIALTVVTPRVFRSGETPHLKVTTRNLEKLTFSAYKLNPEAYFRKKHALNNVESLDIGLVAPDAEWTVTVPGYARYKPIETPFDLAKLETPGVFVVKVTDEKHLQATTLVLSSDIDVIVKTSRDQLLVFAQDMKTGLGRPNARVLVAQGNEVILEATTGADGVLLKNWDKPRDVNAALDYLVLDGTNIAGTGLSVPATVSQGVTARAFIYTDRPAYRPGQQVALRGIVREVKDSQYANVPNAVYKLEISDSRGRRIVGRPVTLSAFGTFHETLPLDSGAPVGTYRVRLYQPGKSEFAGQFEVQSYQLQPIDLAFDLKKTVFFRGEPIEADLIAKYQYGAPVANRPVVVRLPDGRIVHAITDVAGKYHIEFPTEGFSEEQTLRLMAQLPQDNVGAVASVVLAVRAFSISVSTPRSVYLDGETFTASITTTDAQGEPTGQSLSVALVKQVPKAGGAITEREVVKKTVQTDPKTGKARVSLRAEDDLGGNYLVRVAGTDRLGNAVVSDAALLISGKKDETRLRLLADRQSYKVGEEASVNLHSRGRSGTAILTWEADRILSYRIVRLAEGDNAVAWAIDGPQFPNFTLTASRMAGDAFDEARLDLRVERDLRLTLRPVKPTVGPGDEAAFEVTAVDQMGRPVSAELALALVDRSLLRQFADKLPPIGPFFYDQTRLGAFSSTSTNTFAYHPATVPVSGSVVEEAEREAAMARNSVEIGRVREQAQSQVALGAMMDGSKPAMTPPPASAPAPAGGEPMIAGGFGGGGSVLGRAPEGYEYVVGPGAVKLRKKEDSANKDSSVNAFQEKAENEAIIFFRLVDRDELEVGRGTVADKIEEDQKAGRRLNKLAPGSVRYSNSRAPGAQPNLPRERFVESAYWNPSVITDKEGKAVVKFRAPMALSSYLMTARGVTGSDTLVGQTTSELTVRKDFFVDLKIPSALTQGDKPRFIAQVHHLGLKGAVTLKLGIYAGGRDQVFPKSIEVKDDGVDEVVFEPFEVPDGENVRLTLTAASGAAKDELVVEVPVRPWGVQAIASASGTSSNNATVFVGLPGGRAYENPEMLVVISPTLRRLLVELALGRDFYPLTGKEDIALNACIMPPTANTIADRASDLLAATSALGYLKSSRGSSSAPEASRLTERIQGLVAELIAAQNDDGGWPWVHALGTTNQPRPSDRNTSAQVVWALASAEPLSLLTDPAALDKSTNYLASEFAKAGGGNTETRAMILHALATRGKASFETANTLNRFRQNLSDASLAYLALTFAQLDRKPLASEILDILGPRAKTERAAPGDKPRTYWTGSGTTSWMRTPAETTALVALAYARVRPQAPELSGAVEWLLAHRQGFGWQPHKAKGPALAALADFYGKAQTAEDRYQLVVAVNDAEVYRATVLGTTEGKAVLVPREALKAADRNRVRFEIEGRGTFGYSVTLTGFTRDFGPDQNRANRSALVNRRVYLSADPELDGKTLPTGFSTAVNPSHFENRVSQVALGGRARVLLDTSRVIPVNQPEWERDFLIVEEHIPAGSTLIEGSVRTVASSFTVAENVLTLYYAPDQWPGQTSYDVYGYLPGQYRTLPVSIRSAYDPGRSHLGLPGDLRVLSGGETSTDPYKPTPDELYARGKAHFDAGRLTDAAPPLEELFNAYTLRDDITKDAARMLLLINIKEYAPRKVVQYFEVIKEKAPETVVTFDDLLVIGRAYRDINEYERAYLVWRGVVEASYLEDARVGEALRERGKTLEGIAYLLDLWREYPNSASIESDLFALAQVLARHAGEAFSNPALRQEMASAGIARSELLLQSIRLMQVVLSQSPKSPTADEISLALVGNFLDLEDFPAVVKLSSRYAKLYPKSTFLDSFQYSEALGEFHLGHYDRAVEVAETIAKATYLDASGVEQPSPNKWQAIYILGQIYDAKREPGKALGYYKQVAERFTDAQGAITAFTRKDLKLPEVSVVRPKTAVAVSAVPKEGQGEGLRNVGPREKDPEPKQKPEVEVDYRNIAEADVKVYPVDLMRLYLTRRNLDQVAGIDLAGITPLHETTVKLGSGEDYADKVRAIDLPLKKEGAYLVMVRGGNLYASGIVLVSPLELEVLEEPASGRIRVTVRDALTKELLPKVQVKVIGSANSSFLSGETDLRGVYVAEGVTGEVAAVARQGKAQYAFYRGKTYLGAQAGQNANMPAVVPAKPGAADPLMNQSLDNNLKILNDSNRARQIDQYEQRVKGKAPELPGAPAGGFR